MADHEIILQLQQTTAASAWAGNVFHAYVR